MLLEIARVVDVTVDTPTVYLRDLGDGKQVLRSDGKLTVKRNIVDKGFHRADGRLKQKRFAGNFENLGPSGTNRMVVNRLNDSNDNPV